MTITDYLLGITTSILGTIITSGAVILYANFKVSEIKKDIQNNLSDIQLNKIGWYDYLKRYGDLYYKLNNNLKKNGGIKWEISNAVGALKMIRETKSEAQKTLFSRIVNARKIAELEKYESTIIKYLESYSTNIQNSNL